MEKQRLYEVTFLVNGYIIYRLKANNENEAIDNAELFMQTSLETSSKLQKADLSYTDSPIAEEIKQ